MLYWKRPTRRAITFWFSLYNWESWKQWPRCLKLPQRFWKTRMPRKMQIRGLLLIRELDHLQKWAIDLYTYMKLMDSLVPIWFMAPLSRNFVFVSDDSPLKWWSSGMNLLGKNASVNCTPNLSLFLSLHLSHACNFRNAWPSYCTCGQRSSQFSIIPLVGCRQTRFC